MTAAADGNAPRTVPSLPVQRGAGRLDRLVAAMQPASRELALVRVGGHVEEVASSHIKVGGLARQVGLGSCVEVVTGGDSSLGEVIAIQQHSVTVKLFAAAPRIGLGSRVWLRDELMVRPDASWIGRTVNALGQPIDGQGHLGNGDKAYPLDGEPLAPLALDRIRNPCTTGVRAIDLFTPICTGQRIGVFAGSGVGKSTLISMLTRSSGFKTVVVALVAERAREVREFIEDVIRPSGAKAITVVATSSESAMMRKLSAKTAMTIAEYFRDLGDDVLLVVDSVTRYAHAMREIALAAGEPPVARGYAPSVFAELPRLLERAGPGTPSTGSITGVFSVLVDGDDHNDPVADTVRGILDGHIVLDRSIADQGRYPAINPLSSISRLAGLAWTKEEAALVRRLRALIARYEDTRELRTLGAYKPGADPELDQAVAVVPLIYKHLTQAPDDLPSRKPFDELAAALAELQQSPASAREGDGRTSRAPSPGQAPGGRT